MKTKLCENCNETVNCCECLGPIQQDTPFNVKGPKGMFLKGLSETLEDAGYFPDVKAEILRAVNSHEALLETLKEASEDLLSLTEKEVAPLGVRAALNRLLRAIKQAEGK